MDMSTSGYNCLSFRILYSRKNIPVLKCILVAGLLGFERCPATGADASLDKFFKKTG